MTFQNLKLKLWEMLFLLLKVESVVFSKFCLHRARDFTLSPSLRKFLGTPMFSLIYIYISIQYNANSSQFYKFELFCSDNKRNKWFLVFYMREEIKDEYINEWNVQKCSWWFSSALKRCWYTSIAWLSLTMWHWRTC